MLRNRIEQETDKLHGVVTALDESDIKLGHFTLLENWIPSTVASIKKKRGVVLFTSPTVTMAAPSLCTAVCTDTSERGQQLLTVETAFDQVNSRVGNLRTSWGYIADGELYSLVGEATCAGGNMTYGNTCTQINHFINDEATVEEILTIPDITGADSNINTRLGVSDQPIWASTSNAYGGLRIYYGLGLTHVDYATPDINGGGHDINAFAINGNHVWTYSPCCLSSLVAKVAFSVFDRASGTLLNTFYSFGAVDNVAVGNMQLTTDYLYCLGSLAGATLLYKINRADGTIADSLNVTALAPQFAFIANDDLIYLLCTGTPSSVVYVKNFSTVTFVGYTPSVGLSSFGYGTGIWNNGILYWGGSGFGGVTTDVFKISVECPEPPTALVIASVTAAATVAAGASIAFSWEDVLLPAASDTVLMKLAPAAGTHGLSGATVATFTNAAALATGSNTLAVPGGTAPGSYVLMYASLGTIWTATSNTFTVT